jgi:adenylate cyclase
MGKEIERKYLVKGTAWRGLTKGVRYRQGYLNRDKERTVRIRSTGAKAYITIKGLIVGASRPEYEYEIPVADGNAMLDTLAERPLIEKNRYRIPHGNVTIEVDEFLGERRARSGRGRAQERGSARRQAGLAGGGSHGRPQVLQRQPGGAPVFDLVVRASPIRTERREAHEDQVPNEICRAGGAAAGPGAVG